MSLQSLKDLGAQRNKLLGKLERSLAIQSVFPEAFAHGKCVSCWVGAPLGRDRDGLRFALRLQITDGAGALREFPQSEVPAVLWPSPTLGRLP